MTVSLKIYVKLLYEGTTVYRPVNAKHIKSNIYQILRDLSSDHYEYTDVTGYTWKCSNDIDSSECFDLGIECGQICSALRGFEAISIGPSGTCKENEINALTVDGTCNLLEYSISCNSDGVLSAVRPGINNQIAGFMSEHGTKFYCQNTQRDIVEFFPPEASLLFD